MIGPDLDFSWLIDWLGLRRAHLCLHYHLGLIEVLDASGLWRLSSLVLFPQALNFPAHCAVPCSRPNHRHGLGLEPELLSVTDLQRKVKVPTLMSSASVLPRPSRQRLVRWEDSLLNHLGEFVSRQLGKLFRFP